MKKTVTKKEYEIYLNEVGECLNIRHMKFEDYIENFCIFDNRNSFIESFDSYEEILKKKYPDNYTVYCRGHFVKHIKEFKNLKKVELDELKKALDAFAMVFYGLFC